MSERRSRDTAISIAWSSTSAGLGIDCRMSALESTRPGSVLVLGGVPGAGKIVAVQEVVAGVAGEVVLPQVAVQVVAFRAAAEVVAKPPG